MNFFINQYKLFYLRTKGVQVQSSCLIGDNVKTNLGVAFGKKGSIEIKNKTEISHGVILDCWGGSIAIDENVFIGPYSVLYGHGGIKIGKDTLIAMHCRVLSSNHTIPDPLTCIRTQPNIRLPTVIGKDVWLGTGVTILGGVEIGDGSIVGAGAVVTKNLPPYSIAMGVPAQIMRVRQ